MYVYNHNAHHLRCPGNMSCALMFQMHFLSASLSATSIVYMQMQSIELYLYSWVFYVFNLEESHEEDRFQQMSTQISTDFQHHQQTVAATHTHTLPVYWVSLEHVCIKIHFSNYHNFIRCSKQHRSIDIEFIQWIIFTHVDCEIHTHLLQHYKSFENNFKKEIVLHPPCGWNLQ